MSYADRVRGARNPQEAMLVIAIALDDLMDELCNRCPEQPADPWGEWQPPAAELRAAPTVRAERQQSEVQAIRDRLATETDGEERLALEARLRLLQEDGQALDVRPEQGRREQLDEDASVVNIPPASPERMADRVEFAKAHKLHEFGTLPAEEFIPAYAKGGPMWLYAGNRDGVVQMPLHVRQGLILDVMQDSNAAAQEMARDILKDTGTGQSADFAVEALRG